MVLAIKSDTTQARSVVSFRKLNPEDGLALRRLVASCPPLDTNSVYCNLLQSSHFAETSAAAVKNGGLVGSVSAYLLPSDPQTLFVWQVAVAENVRDCGVGRGMLLEILGRPCCREVRFVETTITESNQGSWALFLGLAKVLGAATTRQIAFERQQHFGGLHDSEWLLRIGPISADAIERR